MTLAGNKRANCTVVSTVATEARPVGRCGGRRPRWMRSGGARHFVSPESRKRTGAATARRRGPLSVSNVVRFTGPLLPRDPQRREWTAERPGASSDADDRSFEGAGGFYDRGALGDENL